MPPLPTAALGSGLATIGDGLRALTFRCCWPCWEDHDRVTVATEEHSGEGLCSDCYDARAEGQWDAWCGSYYGGSGPMTLAEQMAEGRRLK